MTSPAFDPRFSFARKHVEETCEDTTLVLAVDQVYQDLKAHLGPQGCPRGHGLLETFFGFNSPRSLYPDMQVYQPVTVRSLETADRIRVWKELTELICTLDEERQESGILLSARSGAGKTVAALKAFFDCLLCPSDGTDPRLAGYLPCWVRLDADDHQGSVAKLVARTLGQPDLPDSWVNHSPPLLLFFDLNAATSAVRDHVAEQLNLFHRDCAGRGHRCIVAYRSTQDDDNTIRLLTKDRRFGRYDMDPLRDEVARLYLRNIRNFEDQVFQHHGLKPRPRDIDADEEHLLKLIDQFATGGNSLISTPLLMHFCSMLRPEECASVHTLANLYGHVVDRLIDRNQVNYPEHMNDLPRGREAILTAMCRVATVMLVEGKTTLDRIRLDEVLSNPAGGKPGRIGGRPWWPADRFWHKSSYFRDRFGAARGRMAAERELQVLREFALLRKTREQFGFLHDSLLYYFATLTVRHHEGPGMPSQQDGLDPKWFVKTAERIRTDPAAWNLPARFLGGMLMDLEQARALVSAFISAEPAPGMPAVLLQLLRGMGNLATEDEILRPILRFVDREQDRLANDPDRLYQELYNELAVAYKPTDVGDWLQRLGRPKRPFTLLIRTVPRQKKSMEIRRFNCEMGSVHTFCFSRDGQRVLSGSGNALLTSPDYTVRLWDIQAHRELRRFEGHTDDVTSVCFSADSRLILSGSRDCTVRLWNAETGTELSRFKGHEGGVTSVCFSSDGRLILSGSEDCTIRLWDLTLRRELHRLDAHTSTSLPVLFPSCAACFSPNGSLVLGCLGGCTVYLWDVETRTELRRFEGHTSLVTSVCFSADSRLILSGSHDCTVRLWNAETGTELSRFKGHEGGVTSVCFSPDGRLILSGSEDCAVRLWNTETGTELSRFKGHVEAVNSVSFSPDGREVFSGSNDRTVRTWAVEADREHIRPEGHTGPVAYVCFSPQGGQILSWSDDCTIRLWDTEKGEELHFLASFKGSVRDIPPPHRFAVQGPCPCFSPDGRLILDGSRGDIIRLWEATSGKELHRLEGNLYGVRSVCFSPTGRHVLSGCRDGTIRLWDTSSGKELLQLDGHQEGWSVCFSPNGRWVLSGGNNVVGLWDLETRQELYRLSYPDGFLLAGCFSPDGRQVLSSQSSGYTYVCLWDIETGREFRRFNGYFKRSCFSPDGRQVLSVSSDYACLWDMETGRELCRFEGSFRHICFSPDGQVILGATWNGTVLLWEAASGKEVARTWVEGGCTTAISEDGQRVVAGDAIGQVHFWRIEELSQPSGSSRRKGTRQTKGGPAKSHFGRGASRTADADRLKDYPDMAPEPDSSPNDA